MNSFDLRAKWKWRLPCAKMVNNHEFYCSIVHGKSVLHVGCTDHKEIIDIKIKRHEFLHLKLMEYAKIVHGIDINKKAIEYLCTNYNINNIYYCDITQTSLPDTLLPFYDIILIPEVIEHVLDVGSFLRAVKRFMVPQSWLIIGTPNGFKLHNLFTVLKGYEEVNPDHKYYFSYATLKSLIEALGFAIEKWYIYICNPHRDLFKYGISSFSSVLKS